MGRNNQVRLHRKNEGGVTILIVLLPYNVLIIIKIEHLDTYLIYQLNKL